jgi:uncharacterized protein
MSKVDIRIIPNPLTERPVLFDPQSLSLARLSEQQSARIGRLVEAGFGGAPALADDELALWGELENFGASAAVSDSTLQETTVNQLTLSNTYTCNMGCTYCYNELDLKPVKGSESRAAMTEETAADAIDQVISELPDNSSLNLFFIGGEPLLEPRLLTFAVAHAKHRAAPRRIKVKPTIYTNATLMTSAVLEWVDRERVSVVISIDGPGHLNANRVYLSGRPTIHVVLRNLERLRPTQDLHRVRAVSTPSTPILPLHKYLLALGFNEIHVQPLYDDSGISHATEDDMLGLLSWWKDLLLEGTVIDIMPFSSYFVKLLSRGRATASWLPCNAAKNAVTVGPDGRVYSCHHAIEEPEYVMGTVADGMPSAARRREFFHSVEDRLHCSRCWAKHVCGGECYHRASSAGLEQDDVLPATCKERRTLIGLTLDAFAQVAKERPASLIALAKGNYSAVQPDRAAYEARDLASFVS